jgi:hypothetical protein
MDSQADLSLRETALCYLLDPGNKTRRAYTSAQVHRATTHAHTTGHRATTRMHEQPDMGHECWNGVPSPSGRSMDTRRLATLGQRSVSNGGCTQTRSEVQPIMTTLTLACIGLNRFVLFFTSSITDTLFTTARTPTTIPPTLFNNEH